MENPSGQKYRPMQRTSSDKSGSNSPPPRGSVFSRKNDQSSQNSRDHHAHGSNSNDLGQQNSRVYNRFSMMSINDLKSERFNAPNSIIKDRFFNFNNNNNNSSNNSNWTRNNIRRESTSTTTDAESNKFTHHPHHHQNYHQQAGSQNSQLVKQQEQATAAANAAAMQTLQQIQEAKPGNKRAILVDLPEYLYSIPALASFFEPYGEVAMLQILPRQKMWDGDLIDLLGASMCNRLSQQSYCAVVEFYSARMAKFIIGILRKRLPILKFRCALLKPSAGIELTNQADNLGLENAVRLRHVSKNKTSSTTASDSSVHGADNSLDSSSTTSSDNKNSILPQPAAVLVETSSEESGLEEMASSGQNSNHSDSDEASSQQSPSQSAGQQSSSRTTSGDEQRFVTSFQIQLNR